MRAGFVVLLGLLELIVRKRTHNDKVHEHDEAHDSHQTRHPRCTGRRQAFRGILPWPPGHRLERRVLYHLVQVVVLRRREAARGVDGRVVGVRGRGRRQDDHGRGRLFVILLNVSIFDPRRNCYRQEASGEVYDVGEEEARTNIERLEVAPREEAFQKR